MSLSKIVLKIVDLVKRFSVCELSFGFPSWQSPVFSSSMYCVVCSSANMPESDIVSYLWAERWAAWPEWRREAGGRKARVSTTEPSSLWTTRWDAEQRGPTPTQTTSSVCMLSSRTAASDAARNYPTTPRHWPEKQVWGEKKQSVRAER